MDQYLLFLALIPGVIIIIFIFRKDKVEHEPWGLIFKLLIFGAISCIPAMFLEMGISAYGPKFEMGTVEYAVFEAFCIAALCEEVCKYVLLRLGSWRNRNFDYRFDGIVYGVAVAVGFALLENVLYVMDGGIEVAVMRGVLAVPLHAFCGVFMGIYYGAAKKAQIDGNKSLCTTNTIKAIVIPILIHGIYDALAFMGTNATSIILLVFVGCMYFIAIKKINQYSRDDWKAAFYYTRSRMFLSDINKNGSDDVDNWTFKN